SSSRRSTSLDDDRYRSYGPHDGVLNLVLAIVAFVFDGGGFCCLCGSFLSLVLSVYVIIKSSLSISEITKGIMDPSGRVMLEIARAIAIVNVLLGIGEVVLTWSVNFARLSGGGNNF